MGVLAAEIGKLEEALPFFNAALEVNSGIEQYWISYINTLINLNRIDDGKSALIQAKENGVKGDAFDYFEEICEQRETEGSISVDQDPMQHQLRSVMDLYNQGELQQTLVQIKQLLKQSPDSVVLYNLLGAVYAGLQEFEKAIRSYKRAIKIKPNYAEAYGNMGIALNEKGDFDEAIISYRQAIKINPDLVETYGNLGDALKNKGDLDGAINCFVQAIKIEPKFADTHYNLGVLLQKKGALDEAINSYRQAINIKPGHAAAYRNIGNAFKEKGQLDEALSSYQQATVIKPDCAQTHNNMGITLKDKGDLDEAISSYRQAIMIKPDFAEAYNNMGVVQREKGDLDKAINSYKRAIEIKPNFAEAFSNMGNALKNVIFTEIEPGMAEIALTLLAKKNYVRASDIAPACLSILKSHPAIKSAIEHHAANRLEEFLPEIVSDLSAVPLLVQLMSMCPLFDSEIEAILSSIRCARLIVIPEFSGTPEILAFYSALAMQCFTNEYIYSQRESEIKALSELEKAVGQGLKMGQQPHPSAIVCLASYKILYEYSWCKLLVIPDTLKELARKQIWDIEEENRVKLKMPLLGEISNDVSLEVQGQYEKNPYPIWINCSIPLAMEPISKILSDLNLKIYDVISFKNLSPNILVAGCGTGQHSIETSLRFKDCKVLAIDLSLSSLAYAKRKTEELGLTNI
jgi:tetratricopeptide (TPR) repeat protein